MTVRVVDIETTGVDPSSDAVIEIACAELTKAGKLVNTFDTLIACGQPIEPEASAAHHIIAEDLEGAPPIEEVIGKLTGADAYVAHNATFERSFLERWLGNDAPWVCTYRCALRVWPDLPSHSNQALRYRLGLVEPFGTPRAELKAHRALSDAIVTGAIFLKLTKAAKWRDLVQWSYEPPLHTICRLPKHKGKRYEQIANEDPSYLDWIINKSDLDEATKFSAQHWLEFYARG